MTRRILVTRPEPGASATARRLVAAGFDPVVVPLTKIVPIRGTIPAGDFDAVMATSANAPRYLAPEAAAALAVLPFYAVGEATAAAAREAGFRDVRSGSGTGQALARFVADDLGRGARLLFLAGRLRTPTTEQALVAAGITVAPVEVYNTVKVGLSADDLDNALGDAPLDAVLFHSRAAAEVVSEHSFVHSLEDATFLCLSERIAACLPEALRRRARVASKPDEDALIALIE